MTMATSSKINRDPSVLPVRDNYGVHAAQTAFANLAASEALPYDHPGQGVLLARAQAYATLAVSQFASWAQ
jgi:hypothetical protein